MKRFIDQQRRVVDNYNMSFEKIAPLLWAVGSINCFVTMQVFVKLLSPYLSTQYIIVLRSVLLLALNSLFVLNSSEYQPYDPPLLAEGDPPVPRKYFSFNIKNNFLLMLKRQFWTAVSINIFLSSLRHVELSTANALYNLSPVLTFFLEAVYFKRSIDKVKLGLTILSFLGVYIIIDPSFGNREGEAFNWWLLMPLAASVAVCINFLYLHQMSGKFKEIQVLEYTYSSQLLLSGLLMAVLGGVGSPTSPSIEASYLVMGGYLLCIVIFAYASNFLRIKTLFKRRPSEVLAFNYTGLIYSIFLDVVVFKHSLSLAQVAGALLTSAGLLSQLLLDLFKKQ